MSDQQITLKSVYDLRVNASDEPIRYRIPAYQRGFRWTPTQVSQLLEDIRDFIKRDNPQPEEFYCLQPLVLLANDDGAFEVVDGQQRLTTLLLILRHFNHRQSPEYRLKLFSVEYKTRPDFLSFLDNPSTITSESNIDYFHITQAANTIKEWFNKRPNEVEDIKSALLNRAKVIWFQLSSNENPVAAFTRLNVGKIPLTNGELIRALFLKRAKPGQPGPLPLRIAHEWDLLEKTLQDPDFWAFLSNNTAQPGGRIDFIFDLVARQQGMTQSPDDYATFNHFSRKLAAKNPDPEGEWLNIKKTFMLLEEWFHDRRLYHMVGFLIWNGLDVNHLCALATGNPKRAFKDKLRATILERVLGSGGPAGIAGNEFREWIADQLDTLEYSRDSRRIRAVLLLFNLATLLQNPMSNMRFPFESFKTAFWDIEHVRSVAPDRPGNRKGQVEWLQHSLGYLKSTGEEPDLQTEIQAFIDLPHKEATDALFDPIYEKMLRHFKEADEEEPDHSIANLVLLDYATNRSYKNAVFAVKRHRVLSLDRDGVFVPLCTRNVFLKCYNPRVDHVMFWTQNDRDGYRQAIVETLHSFFTGGWIHE